MKKTIFCICRNDHQIEVIIDELRAAHFSNGDISVMYPDRAADSSVGGRPAGFLARTAGHLGARVALLTDFGEFAVPGLGPVMAAGPLKAALVAGGATGRGLTAALVGFGIPEYEAKMYEGRLREGGSLLSVHAMDAHQIDRIQMIFRRDGATDISAPPEERFGRMTALYMR